MKKNKTTAILFASAIAGSVLLQSCATLFGTKTSPAIMVNAPADLKVYENGQELTLQKVTSQARAQGTNTTVTYYAWGVELDKKVKKHTLTLESNGKKADVNLKMKASGGVVFLDLIFTGGIGIVVDGITKKWRIVKNRHVDVENILAGQPPRGQGKLKRLIRKSAN